MPTFRSGEENCRPASTQDTTLDTGDVGNLQEPVRRLVTAPVLAENVEWPGTQAGRAYTDQSVIQRQVRTAVERGANGAFRAVAHSAASDRTDQRRTERGG